MATVSLTQYNNLTVLGDASNMDAHQLQSGDVLIHHRHTGNAGWPSGPLNPFHCSIVNVEDYAVLYDSMPGDGVRSKPLMMLHDDCVVFRAGGQVNAGQGDAVGNMARDLRIRKVGYSDHCGGIGRALGSVFASKKFNAGARQRLDKYKQRGKPKNAICSEFVILCYQMVLGEGDTHFIDIDGKFTTPKGPGLPR